MGQEPKKYHITDDGDIYRVNDDGSFTSMGNAEQRNAPQHTAPDQNKHCEIILESTGPQKLLVVRNIAELTNRSLKSAKAVADYTPSVIIDNISEDKAQQIKSEFESIGAIVSVRPCNPRTKTEAPTDRVSNQNIKEKRGGCLGIMLVFVLTTATLITSLI